MKDIIAKELNKNGNIEPFKVYTNNINGVQKIQKYRLRKISPFLASFINAVHAAQGGKRLI